MSKPRPIHNINRELRSQPDDAEPSFSYEQESFLMGAKEEDVEDEFHRRLQSSRRDSGGSFWRTNSNSGEFAGPSFSSMSMKQRQDSVGTTNGASASVGAGGGGGDRRNNGRLGVSLQMQSPEQNDSSVSNIRGLMFPFHISYTRFIPASEKLDIVALMLVHVDGDFALMRRDQIRFAMMCCVDGGIYQRPVTLRL